MTASSSTEKVDLRRVIAGYRARHGRFEELTLPPVAYLMIDGHGDPNTDPRYPDALASLYPLAYALKFLSKSDLGRDHVVMPLEGLWWSDDPAAFTTARDKTRWDWTLMIAVPGWIEPEHVDAARAIAARKTPPRLDDVRFATLEEGRCVQTLHIGSFDDEAPVLARLHEQEIPARGLVMTGTHHEIYLTDARRTPPARQRTILRQPARPSPAPGQR